MSPVCKMADNGRLSVHQKVKAVLFYAETKSVVATQETLVTGLPIYTQWFMQDGARPHTLQT